MAICTLLAPPTREQWPAWGFEHAMAHRNVLGAMSFVPDDPHGFFGTAALSRFTGLPYYIDPQLNESMWHLDHGQAHQDYQLTLPGSFHSAGQTGTINPTTDFVDMNFRNPGLLQWWTFANHQQHLNAMSVLPLQLRYPFW